MVWYFVPSLRLLSGHVIQYDVGTGVYFRLAVILLCGSVTYPKYESIRKGYPIFVPNRIESNQIESNGDESDRIAMVFHYQCQYEYDNIHQMEDFTCKVSTW